MNGKVCASQLALFVTSLEVLYTWSPLKRPTCTYSMKKQTHNQQRGPAKNKALRHIDQSPIF